MGKKLLRYYDFIEEKLGRTGRTELSKLTLKPSSIAGGLPDDEPTLKLFRDAIFKLTGQRPPEA